MIRDGPYPGVKLGTQQAGGSPQMVGFPSKKGQEKLASANMEDDGNKTGSAFEGRRLTYRTPSKGENTIS